jgi:ferredoxin
MAKRKIVHINQALCNGCGNCIPKCAEGALQIVNGKATITKDIYCDGLGACLGHCPQNAITIIEREADDFNEQAARHHTQKTQTQTHKKPAQPQWPIKLNLAPVKAPFYERAHLLLAADCAPAACPTFRKTLQPEKRLLIGCPKFDDANAYAQKLAEILKHNNIASITIAHMEVPCCSSLKWVADKAVEASGKQIPTRQYVITIKGKITEP